MSISELQEQQAATSALSISLFGEHPCRRSFQKVELAKI
jgi:hypothetical protein